MNNEELTINFTDNPENWTNFYQVPPNISASTYNNFNFYEFRSKLLEEIQFKIRHLEQSLEVVREKNSKQFIKGQIVALNEIRCSIERNDWACDRGEYYVGW